EDLCFRNLDGTGTVHAEIGPAAGTLTTRTKLRSLSAAGPMVIVAFDVTVHAGSTLLYSLDTVFGFFPEEAMKNQLGLGASEAERARLLEPAPIVDLHGETRYRAHPTLRLAGDRLL